MIKRFALIRLLAIAVMGLGAGCVRFHAQPLSPAKAALELESRSLTNADLKVFLEKNLRRDFPDWPATAWDFDMLTLAAFYYHPDLAVARAQWNIAQAGVKTAAGRPNPTLALTPTYNTTHSVPSPWAPAVTFDLPIETAGKRGHRMAAAEHLSEAARFNLATVAWQVRSNLRLSLIDSWAAAQRERGLRKQVSFQEQIVKLIEQQVQAGAMAGSDAAAPRIALQKLRLDYLDAQRQSVEARVSVAQAIGIPAAAFGVPPSGGPGGEPSEGGTPNLEAGVMGQFMSATNLTSAEVRRAALLSRADVLGALAEYAAAQATLQTEIAKQYPDVHLNPGYQYDQGDNKWSLGLTFDLPILNQNQGPIAEAGARREEAAAKFNAVQSKVLAEIERAAEVFQISDRNASVLQSLREAQARQRDSVAAQFKAGAADQLEWLNAEFEFAAAELVQLDGEVKLRQAAARLEQAIQRPLEFLAAIELNHTAQAGQEKP